MDKDEKFVFTNKTLYILKHGDKIKWDNKVSCKEEIINTSCFKKAIGDLRTIFKCEKCGCEFIPKDKDIKKFDWNGLVYKEKCDCPECDEVIEKYISIDGKTFEECLDKYDSINNAQRVLDRVFLMILGHGWGIGESVSKNCELNEIGEEKVKRKLGKLRGCLDVWRKMKEMKW